MKHLLLIANYDDFYNTRAEVVEHFLLEYQVTIAYPYGPNAEKFREMGAAFWDTPMDRRGVNPYRDLKLLWLYRNMIQKLRPDIVLTYSIKPNVYAGFICKQYGIPYLANITGLGSALEGGGPLERFALFLYRLAFQKVSKVFLQNEENLAYFESHGLAHGKCRLIPGSGVNLSHFTPLEYPRGGGTVEFLFIARIMREKGIDQYLEAAGYLRSRYPETRFHILGFCEETYENKLSQLEKQGIIQYHGMQMDVRRFLKTCHCVVHPSYYPEGMSNVCLEAGASARPVITTNRSGCRETVVDGVTGYVFPIRNTAALIACMERFLTLSWEEKRAMGLRSRAYVEQKFSRQAVIDAYSEEIKRFIG